MLKKEFKNMSVFNPFEDKFEDLDCEFDCHINSHGKLDHVETSSIISEAGVELFDYLNDKELEKVADEFKNEYGDLV